MLVHLPTATLMRTKGVICREREEYSSLTSDRKPNGKSHLMCDEALGFTEDCSGSELMQHENSKNRLSKTEV